VVERCGDARKRIDECAVEVEDEQRFHPPSMGEVSPFVKDGERRILKSMFSTRSGRSIPNR
jgi:hypothetical protein